MAPPLRGVPLSWRFADVVGLRDETPRVRTLRLRVPGWPGHRAGQHVDVRLTAQDGYQTQRSYSIATRAEGDLLALTIERLEDGEVSPYLTREVRVGDRLEIRGPIGGYFVWEPALGGPLLLVAGGSGVVPLMAMLRERAGPAGAAAARGAGTPRRPSGGPAPARLLYSCRSPDEAIYRAELAESTALTDGPEVLYTFTRVPPPGWTGFSRRIDAAMLADVAWTPREAPLAYVCGPTGFVERAAETLSALGHAPERIRTERFGPSGRG